MVIIIFIIFIIIIIIVAIMIIMAAQQIPTAPCIGEKTIFFGKYSKSRFVNTYGINYKLII